MNELTAKTQRGQTEAAKLLLICNSFERLQVSQKSRDTLLDLCTYGLTTSLLEIYRRLKK